MRQSIEGFATEAGTRAYRDRSADRTAPGHFRDFAGLALSSIGIGTYLGKDDAEDDALYGEALLASLERGVNVIDSAINYRSQRSERAIGAALKKAILEDRWIGREEIVVATKGGFLPFDGGRPKNARAYFEETYVKPGIFGWHDVVASCHCLTPRYLRDQIQRSRANLGLATIDIYYLHNPEMQLEEVPRSEFLKRMRAAFEALEEACVKNEIRCYGTATWNGYRGVPGGDVGYLSFSELSQIARDAGGEKHHFRAVQLPFNLSMTEAASALNQSARGRSASLLQAAAGEAYVMASASMSQGRLSHRLPGSIASALGLDTDAQRALQFARSTPGIGTALVGMKRTEHVVENLKVAAVPLAPPDVVLSLMRAG